MTDPSPGLLDTSVFIARATKRPLGELPDHVAVSVVTIGELQLGVLSAPVMTSWARLVTDCRAAGIHRMVKLTDALIAATAIEHGLAVVTQDDDYDRIAGAHTPLRVIKV